MERVGLKVDDTEKERWREREREKEEGTSRGTVSGAIIISKERGETEDFPSLCSLFFSPTPFQPLALLRPPSIQTRATLLTDADFATGSEARASTGSH